MLAFTNMGAILEKMEADVDILQAVMDCFH